MPAPVQVPDMNQYPLREQRKQRSREALLRSASKLFACKGFKATTLEEVAEGAGLHVQTLYRHFPNKAELAAAIDRVYFDRFRKAFQARDTDTLTFWRGWVETAARRLTRDGGAAYRRGLENFYTQPSLSGTYLKTAYPGISSITRHWAIILASLACYCSAFNLASWAASFFD